MTKPEHQLPPQHQKNLNDLLDSTEEVSMMLDRRSVGLFFASLNDGDIIDGGPTPDWIPLQARLIRPGFCYLWGKWHEQFPDRAPPWPWWIFPKKEVYITP
jgi:hypothetical protein